MAFTMILLFILSANAWINGDNSISWIVALGAASIFAVLNLDSILSFVSGLCKKSNYGTKPYYKEQNN